MGFHDECGVIGVYGAKNAASLSYFGLVSLQHRGQESAGIAVSNGERIALKKEIGLVGDIFKQADFERLSGNIAIGHVRYATAGGRTIENAQPFLNSFKLGSIALAHNGQLVNHAELRAMLEDHGSTFSSSSDSEVILKLIVRKFVENGGHLGRKKNFQKGQSAQDQQNNDGLSKNNGENFSTSDSNSIFITSVIEAVKDIKGSFALCIMTENMLIGVRDPNGIRPLCLGKIDRVLGAEPLGEGLAEKALVEQGRNQCGCSEGEKEDKLKSASADFLTASDSSGRSTASSLSTTFILASESCAIDAMNGSFVRDVNPGEIVVIKKGENGTEIKSYQLEKNEKKTCIFEYVYFARPDSVIDGIAVQEARYKMGEMLAKESLVDADCVIGVPDSGIGAAMGYAKASRIPYVTGILKNKYIGRTFIAPTQAEREAMVFVKLNAIKSDLEGKRVVVIDDSIVRGTTSRRLVEILRRAGAKEVHFRVSSPQVKFPCHLGIDTPSKNELISSTHELEEIRREIGADSLAFISLEGMIKALEECSGGDKVVCESAKSTGDACSTKDEKSTEGAAGNETACSAGNKVVCESLSSAGAHIECSAKNAGFCTGCFNGIYPV